MNNRLRPERTASDSDTRRPTRFVSILSGKGGVGKTVIACNLAERIASRGCRVLLVDADFGLGNVHSDMGQLEDAIEHYMEALGNLKETENYQQISRAYNNLGDTYLLKKDWDLALENLEKSIEFADKGGWFNMRAWAEANIAMVLVNMGEFDKAKTILESSLNNLEELGDRAGIGGAYQAYGVLYTKTTNWDMAILSYQKAVDIYTEINTPVSLAQCRYSLGVAYKSKGNVKRANEELRRAANLYTHLKMDDFVKKALAEISN